MSDPTTAPTTETEPTVPGKKPRCRALTTDGHRCKKGATYNGHLCFSHAHHRHPVYPHPSHVVIPLLEDHASVQLVLSEVAHGLMTEKIDAERGRALIYLCQVATATLPRPPRMPSPQTPGAPSLSRRPSGATGWETDDPSQKSANDGKSELETGNRGLETSEAQADDDDYVYRLALDYEGLISGDGDLPAPNAYWQPPAPHVTPWDIIAAAPNQSKPTSRDPLDPDTHRCDCPICAEIKKMQGDPLNHPHLQPVVNPYCKKNRAGCEGPGSPTQCSYCEGIYKYAPRKYARVRHTARVPHPWPGDEQPTVRIPGVATWEEPSRVPHPSRPASQGERVGGRLGGPFKPGAGFSGEPDTSYEEPVQLLPNPIPEQFPDNDPMIGRRIDLNASAEPGDRLPALPLPAPGFRLPAPSYGNTLRVLPSNPFAMKQTIPTATGGYPSGGWFANGTMSNEGREEAATSPCSASSRSTQRRDRRRKDPWSRHAR